MVGQTYAIICAEATGANRETFSVHEAALEAADVSTGQVYA